MAMLMVSLGLIADVRHNFHPFVEGVSEPTYTQEQLDDLKSENHVIEYEGRTYDKYKATQKQRQIERTVRKLQRERIAFEASGDTEHEQAAQIKIDRLRKKYGEFSKTAGLRTQTERMAVYVPKGDNS